MSSQFSEERCRKRTRWAQEVAAKLSGACSKKRSCHLFAAFVESLWNETPAGQPLEALLPALPSTRARQQWQRRLLRYRDSWHRLHAQDANATRERNEMQVDGEHADERMQGAALPQ